MPASDLEKIGSVVSFDVYAPELGVNFNGVEISAVYNYRTAVRNGRDVDAIHQQIYSRLPSSVPNDPTKYNYVEVITAGGEYVILGIPWIKESTIVVTKTLIYKPSIVIEDATDVTKINQILNQAGYTKIVANDLINQ